MSWPTPPDNSEALYFRHFQRKKFKIGNYSTRQRLDSGYSLGTVTIRPECQLRLPR